MKDLMKDLLTEFEQRLVLNYREGKFTNLLMQDFITLLVTKEHIIDDNTHERVFVYIPCHDDNDDVVRLLFRPLDADLIDIDALQLVLDVAYQESDCTGYDLENIDDGEISFFIDPDYHNDDDVIDLITLIEEAITGVVKSSSM